LTLPIRHPARAFLDRNRWYKQAVIYGVDVDKFADGNGDGIGDFRGLSEKIDYIAALGVDCVWLTPFYKSLGRDNGYDVIDHYGIDPVLGSFGDFIEFLELADQRGIRVIADMVFNHTSDQHVWFQKAREDEDSPFRDYYLWSRERPPENRKPMFPGKESSRWSRDAKAGAYYYHTFYRHQPDLNINNSAVRREFERIMGFWLRLGVSGFRLDAAPHLIELPRAEEGHAGDAYWYLREMREFIQWWRAQVLLLAEANVDPLVVPQYFGQDGGRLDALYNFLLNQYVALGLAREDAEPIRRGLSLSPPIPESGAWIQFLRNADEQDLGRLSTSEREDVFREFAPRPEMQAYRRGIRRRLASMLGGDQARIRMAYSLLFTLPGTPLFMYGDEIGMGEDLSLPERNSVRTAMQWAPLAGAGFSVVEPAPIRVPVVDGGPFRYQKVNVATQEGDHESLLNWMHTLIMTRRRHPEIALGQHRTLDFKQTSVFGAISEWGHESLVSLHNLSRQPCSVRLPEDLPEGLEDMFDNRTYPDSPRPGATLRLDGYGFRWLGARSETSRALQHNGRHTR
jgi:maltose alpha-D-glucosyltransferase/alpha-amylase